MVTEGMFFLSHRHQKDLECLPDVPWSLSHLILPIAQYGNCHKIITFKTIIGKILVFFGGGVKTI